MQLKWPHTVVCRQSLGRSERRHCGRRHHWRRCPRRHCSHGHAQEDPEERRRQRALFPLTAALCRGERGKRCTTFGICRRRCRSCRTHNGDDGEGLIPGSSRIIDLVHTRSTRGTFEERALLWMAPLAAARLDRQGGGAVLDSPLHLRTLFNPRRSAVTSSSPHPCLLGPIAALDMDSVILMGHLSFIVYL